MMTATVFTRRLAAVLPLLRLQTNPPNFLLHPQLLGLLPTSSPSSTASERIPGGGTAELRTAMSAVHPERCTETRSPGSVPYISATHFRRSSSSSSDFFLSLSLIIILIIIILLNANPRELRHTKTRGERSQFFFFCLFFFVVVVESTVVNRNIHIS